VKKEMEMEELNHFITQPMMHHNTKKCSKSFSRYPAFGQNGQRNAAVLS
jgi:hypothetical protein